LTTSQTSTSTSLIHQFQYRGEECEQAGISQFRTYIGAIFELYCCGVVKMEAVYRVILATSNSFTKIAFKSERRRQFCGEEIMLDIGMVMEEMERKGDKQSRKKEQLIASLNQELIQYGEKYQQRCVQNAFNSFHFEQNDEIA
jgi:hypothetical protein